MYHCARKRVNEEFSTPALIVKVPDWLGLRPLLDMVTRKIGGAVEIITISY